MSSKQYNRPLYWDDALKHLNQKDRIISNLILEYKSKLFLKKSKSAFNTLFKIIIGQQISIEAASAIENRIKEKLGRISHVTILNINHEKLRECGLSYRKVEYIKGIADLISKDPKYFSRLRKLSDSDSISELKMLYGIGQWSAEMFLIFYFNRSNILPTGDIGLINSFCRNYKVSRDSFLTIIERYRDIWSPYCTVATWYLWRDIDEDVVQY